MWGQDKTITQFSQRHGIIPTRVGTSYFSYFAALDVGDHPHACGDKFGAIAIVVDSLGSSPRVWGQDVGFLYRFVFFRIIPTRVGTSLAYIAPNSDVWHHPHACGDKFACLYLFTVPIGSSPRVWGQADGRTHWKGLVRIIPTRVGTSL